MNKTIYLNGTEITIKKSFSVRYAMSYRSMPAFNKLIFNATKISYDEIRSKAQEFLEKKRNSDAFNDIRDGGTVLIFGKKKKLNVFFGEKKAFVDTPDSLIVSLDINKINNAENSENEYYRQLNSVIADFYKIALKRKLNALVGEEEERTGIVCGGWEIRSIGSAWGKCIPKDKKIVFSLNLALFDESCIRMVVDHELTHILYPDHGKDFHAFMEKICPDYKKINAYLNR